METSTFINGNPRASEYLTTIPLESNASSSSNSLPPLPDILKAGALFLLVLWTILANFLVFIVLYKNPRLQTVPNLLVGNLALSDFCLALIVLPLSSIYACSGEWLFNATLCNFFVSADILCSTASIWNLSIVGLDRYWAITSPVAYLNKRNKKTACIMILSVWCFSALISLAPLLGWKQIADHGNLVQINGTWQCTFLDLPSYTIYSATGSFFIPTLLMFFVYFKIYQAFAKHRARQIYRQKLAITSRICTFVIRRHIESTILHEISHILPTSDEFAKDMEDEEVQEEEEEVVHENGKEEAKKSPESVRLTQWAPSSVGGICSVQHATIYEENEDEDEGKECQNQKESHKTEKPLANCAERRFADGNGTNTPPKVTFRQTDSIDEESRQKNAGKLANSKKQWRSFSHVEQKLGPREGQNGAKSNNKNEDSTNSNKKVRRDSAIPTDVAATRPTSKLAKLPPDKMPTYEKVRRHKKRKELNIRKSLQTKPRAISAAKERRGVRVLGIILGCFTLCWTPFFVMYVVVQFCSNCTVNPHIEMFITWLGYSNSAMNPIIYTVFNRDYQIALKKLFMGRRAGAMGIGIRSTLQKPMIGFSRSR